MKKKIILGAVVAILVIGSLYTLAHLGTFDNLTSTRLGAAVMNVFSPNTSSSYNIRLSKTVPGAFTFNYKFENVTPPTGQANFDIPIAQFDEKAARKELEAVYPGQEINFGQYRDAWGYPVHENAYQTLSNKKQSFNPFHIKQAFASDDDPHYLGWVNCRANTSVTGYFQAYFQDVGQDTNVGYDDPVYGQTRRNEACQVLQDISVLIKLDTTTVTPDIWFQKDPGNFPPNALAAASSYTRFYSVGPDNGILNKHIITHQNPIPAQGMFDAFVITNFNGIGWDVDSTLNTSTYDLYTVLYHEILHTLGFRSLLPAEITSTGDVHLHDTFDLFSYKDTSLSNPFFSAVTELLQVPIGSPSSWFVTNLVVYRGVKNIVGATPDGVRPIYSPLTWQQGSSLSHFDMDRAGVSYIMHPSISTNTIRSIYYHEKEVLCHLGYMVLGVTGCDKATPAAVNDSISIDETEVCIQPLTNDISFSGGSLSLQSVSPITLQTGDSLTYYQSVDCSGSAQVSPSNARSIKFTVGASADSRWVNYTNRDSVSNRISFPAKIILLKCGASLEEYVCNGDFEMQPIGPQAAANWGYQLVCPDSNTNLEEFLEYNPVGTSIPWWCNYHGSPDIIDDTLTVSGSPFSPGSLPFNCSIFTGNSSCFVDNPDNGHRISRSFSGEILLTRLRSPLIAGQTYFFSADVRVITPSSSSVSFFVELSNGVPNLQYSSPPPQQSVGGEIVFQSTIPVNNMGNEWTHVEGNFTPNTSNQFLILSAQGLWYADNISITEIPEDVCQNLPEIQSVIPSGYYVVDGQCLADVCPNIEGGQLTVPTGYELVNNQCTLIPPPVDQCTNISGVQATIPIGFELINGQCKKKQAVDVCFNIAGIQSVVPAGYYQSLGKCFPKSSVTPIR